MRQLLFVLLLLLPCLHSLGQKKGTITVRKEIQSEQTIPFFKNSDLTLELPTTGAAINRTDVAGDGRFYFGGQVIGDRTKSVRVTTSRLMINSNVLFVTYYTLKVSTGDYSKTFSCSGGQIPAGAMQMMRKYTVTGSICFSNIMVKNRETNEREAHKKSYCMSLR